MGYKFIAHSPGFVVDVVTEYPVIFGFAPVKGNAKVSLGSRVREK